ncbi:TRAP transporter small permease [Salicibibacter cibarius]|uniref:TRAP transporter small permease n=1 Tax=Salicibibacter cibarius TaxID=2743000 RepID=A0A7T6Z2E3_9BACI|nr:TRAP transporter small permease [Salicibibacter cibarius]QQK75735.1 TRAP transporter small permease [Salicibibacter cibarius]
MRTYLQVIDKMNDILKYVTSFFIALLAILVIIQVFSRFVINFPFIWSEEVARYAMVYVVFLGSALATRYNQHIAIDFLLQIVSEKKQNKLKIIITWVSILFFALLCYQGAILTVTVWEQTSPTTGLSMSWAYAAIPLGAGMMLLNALALLSEMKVSGIDEQEGDVQW